MHPPSVGWLKCNVDARFSNKKGITNSGWCLRDSSGRFTNAGIAWDFGLLSVIEGETLVLKEVVQATIHMQLNHVIFECDSQLMLQALHKINDGTYEFSLIILCIKNLLVTHSNFEVKFVKRKVNSVAHMLAKATDSRTRRSVFHLIPLWIEQLLLNDMN